MFFSRIKRTIERYGLFEKEDRLIVGVSAGVDSMVLLHILHSYREAFPLDLIVAHVNHGLRPQEAEKEAELVRKESGRLGLLYEHGQFDVKEFKKRANLSTQDAARRIRFRFFYDVLRRHDAHKIVLGHNADDQSETVLLRLIRGSGLQGLKGMLPMREGRIVRPLLEAWRSEIEAFALAQKIPFLTDSTNARKDYLRNRIRLSLIPLIEAEYQPNFKEILFRTSKILREENDYLEREAEEAYEKMVREEKSVLSFKFSEFRSLHRAIQWRVLKRILEGVDDRERLEEKEWPDIQRVYQKLYSSAPTFLLDLSGGFRAEKRYDLISIVKKEIQAVPPFEVELGFPCRVFIEEIGREVLIEETDRNEFRREQASLETAFMDLEKLRFPLQMRNFRPGDRFFPLGAEGKQKLKDFFIDHKIPKLDRPKVPLLISGEIIAWIVGHRIDERVKITEKTNRILKIEVV